MRHTLIPSLGEERLLEVEANRPSAEPASQGSSKEQRHWQLVAPAQRPRSREVVGISIQGSEAWPKNGAVPGLQMS